MTKYCSVCETDTEHYPSGGCKPCSKRRCDKWRNTNTEGYRESWKRWNKRNPERRQAINNEWKAKNK